MAENIESFEDIGLTEKQRLFCEAYVVDCNAKKAIIGTGSPEKHAMQMGYEMLKVPKVKAYIKFLRSKAAEVAGVTAIRNAQALTEIAYGQEEKYSANEKMKAIEILNKLFGLNEAKKIEVTGENGGPIKVTGMVISKGD